MRIAAALLCVAGASVSPAVAGEAAPPEQDAPAPEPVVVGPPEATGALFEPISATATLVASDADLQIARILAEHTPRIASLRARLQCVPYARAESGIALHGNANTWWRQAAGRYERSEDPKVGAVMVMRGYATAQRGHVAVVRRVISERKIIIDHANWLNQGEITVDVPVMDVSEAGDWSRVRVWHVPGGHWGGRVYVNQGFILPQTLDQPRTQTVAAPGAPPLG